MTNLIERIKDLDAQFITLTGHQAFGYVSQPTPTSTRITFQDGNVFLNEVEAYDYMAWLIDVARYRPKNLPYPFDQELTPEQDRRIT